MPMEVQEEAVSDARLKESHSNLNVYGYGAVAVVKRENLGGKSVVLFFVLFILFNKVCCLFPSPSSWFLTKVSNEEYVGMKVLLIYCTFRVV